MILRAKWILDRSLKPRENGTLHTGNSSREILDLGNSILMPGLFNAHAHLDYTLLRGQVPPGDSFTDWIGRINQRKLQWTESDFATSISVGLEEAIRFGTTSMVNWICHPATLPLQASAMRIWWLWEQISFRSNDPVPDWNIWPDHVTQISPLWKGGLAPHAPFTCHLDLIHKAVDWSAEYRLPWSIHVAESQDEDEMFSRARGPFFDLFRSLGRDLSDCGHGSSLTHLKSQISNLKSPALLVHANLLSKSDLQLLDGISPMVSIVHCPRSHHFFNHPAFPLESLRKRKIRLCLGTDSLASNDDLSMFQEMAALSKAYPDLAPRDIVAMATLHGASAVGMDRQWHDWQDWIALPAPPDGDDLWTSIVNFTGRPHFVMVNGVTQTISP